jgi:hypothetical protein
MARKALSADSFTVDPNDQTNVIGKVADNTINYRRAGFPDTSPSVAAAATAATAQPARGLYPAGTKPAQPAAAPVATIAGVPVAAAPVAAAPGAGPLALLGQVPADPGFNATVAQPGVPRSPLDVLRGTAATSPVAPVPTGAEIAGASVRNAIGGAVNATGRAELGAFDAVTSAIGTGARAVARPFVAGFGAARGFARGALGRTTAAGVSNASAAQFEQPTADNPIPTTETTPVSDIDRSDNAIAKFGKTKRRQFSGF